MKILVTGASGYIGNAIFRKLIKEGHEVYGIDIRGPNVRYNEHVVPGEIYNLDLRRTRSTYEDYFVARFPKMDTIIHCAAFKSVPESMTNPWKYYDNNINSTMSVLKWFEFDRIIFSSTAAVYGETGMILSESDKISPKSIYGKTKAASEEIIEAFCLENKKEFAILRYFNPVGTSEEGIGEVGGTNVLSRFCSAANAADILRVFGFDYATKDGTPVRDYIDLRDLVDAHVIALTKKFGFPLRTKVNVGTGEGISAAELSKMFLEVWRDVTGEDFLLMRIEGRREGDCGYVVASSEVFRTYFNWHPKYNIRDSVKRQIEFFLGKTKDA